VSPKCRVMNRRAVVQGVLAAALGFAAILSVLLGSNGATTEVWIS